MVVKKAQEIKLDAAVCGYLLYLLLKAYFKDLNTNPTNVFKSSV